MKNKILSVVSISILLLVWWCSSNDTSYESDTSYDTYKSEEIYNSYSDNTEYTSTYDDWYSWAEDNDPTTFDECQDEFWTSEAEDWCNEYVQDNYEWDQEFHWDDCTEDCSWHEAWYNRAEENDIDDASSCDWNSSSFNEWCETYVDENY